MHFIDTWKTQKGSNYLGDTRRLLDYSLIYVSTSCVTNKRTQNGKYDRTLVDLYTTKKVES